MMLLVSLAVLPYLITYVLFIHRVLLHGVEVALEVVSDSMLLVKVQLDLRLSYLDGGLMSVFGGFGRGGRVNVVDHSRVVVINS